MAANNGALARIDPHSCSKDWEINAATLLSLLQWQVDPSFRAGVGPLISEATIRFDTRTGQETSARWIDWSSLGNRRTSVPLDIWTFHASVFTPMHR